MGKKQEILDDEIKNFIIISIIVVVIFLVFFWLTSLRINRPYKPTIPKGYVEAEINYEKILMGSVFNMPEENYYVFVKFKNDPYYQMLLDTNKKEYRYYEVDLNSFFNQNWRGEENNQADLKFATNTILLISDGKIVEFLDEKTKIIEHFTSE